MFKFSYFFTVFFCFRSARDRSGAKLGSHRRGLRSPARLHRSWWTSPWGQYATRNIGVRWKKLWNKIVIITWKFNSEFTNMCLHYVCLYVWMFKTFKVITIHTTNIRINILLTVVEWKNTLKQKKVCLRGLMFLFYKMRRNSMHFSKFEKNISNLVDIGRLITKPLLILIYFILLSIRTTLIFKLMFIYLCGN